MSELQIKSESLAKRCEICHCTDFFNPQTNYCSRCNNIRNIEDKQYDTYHAAYPQYFGLKRFFLEQASIIAHVISGLITISVFVLSFISIFAWGSYYFGEENSFAVGI
ncbi:MAG: hypothetical protein AB1489_40380, partial [Acidobacteriota bacterium]